jgi:hypothetical protein
MTSEKGHEPLLTAVSPLTIEIGQPQSAKNSSKDIATFA